MNNKKTTSVWFISYLIVLIVPIVLICATYDIIENIMLSSVVRSNQYILKEKMDGIDTFLNEFVELSISCVTSNELNGFAELSLPIQPSDRYKMAKFMKEWRVAKKAVGVNNIYAYLPKSDFVLGVNSMNSPELFFVTEYGSSKGYERWKRAVVNGTNSGFWLMKTDEAEKLLYVCVPENSILADNRPVLVLEMNIQMLIHTLSNENGGFLIFDDNNNTIVSTEEASGIENDLKNYI